MAKYSFFKKQGRQTADEKSIANEVRYLRSQLNITDTDELHFVCNDIEELKSYRDLLISKTSNSSTEYSQSDESNTEKEYFEDNNTENDEKDTFMSFDENGGFNPMEDAVIERDYTKGELHSSGVDPELSNMANNFDDPDDIPDAKYEEVDDEDAELEGGESTSADDDKLGGDNLEDLSPTQKRKAAKATAITFVEGYASIKLSLGAKFCQYNEDDLLKSSLKGEIDMNDEVGNGITFGDYVPTFNERVIEALTMSPEAKESIIEPLTDVLLENNLALTPMQRLLFAVGQDLVTTAVAVFQLKRETRTILEFLRENQISRNRVLNSQSNYQPSVTPVSQSFVKSESSESINSSSSSNNSNFDPFSSGESVSSFSMNEGAVSHEELLESLSKDAMDVIIDPNHDPNVQVSED